SQSRVRGASSPRRNDRNSARTSCLRFLMPYQIPSLPEPYPTATLPFSPFQWASRLFPQPWAYSPRRCEQISIRAGGEPENKQGRLASRVAPVLFRNHPSLNLPARRLLLRRRGGHLGQH